MILQPSMALDSSGGLDENVSYSLMYLKIWFSVDAMFWDVQEEKPG